MGILKQDFGSDIDQVVDEMFFHVLEIYDCELIDEGQYGHSSAHIDKSSVPQIVRDCDKTICDCFGLFKMTDVQAEARTATLPNWNKDLHIILRDLNNPKILDALGVVRVLKIKACSPGQYMNLLYIEDDYIHGSPITDLSDPNGMMTVRESTRDILTLGFDLEVLISPMHKKVMLLDCVSMRGYPYRWYTQKRAKEPNWRYYEYIEQRI
jgi:hypothetical protein